MKRYADKKQKSVNSDVGEIRLLNRFERKDFLLELLFKPPVRDAHWSHSPEVTKERLEWDVFVNSFRIDKKYQSLCGKSR